MQPISARSGRCWQQPATTAAEPAQKHGWQLLLCNAGVPFSMYSSSWSLQDVISSDCMTSRSGFIFPDNNNKSQLPTYMEVCRNIARAQQPLFVSSHLSGPQTPFSHPLLAHCSFAIFCSCLQCRGTCIKCHLSQALCIGILRVCGTSSHHTLSAACINKFLALNRSHSSLRAPCCSFALRIRST